MSKVTTSLQIPPLYVAGLKTLRQLDEDTVQQLAVALSDAPLLYSPQDLLSNLMQKVDGVATVQLEEILKALLSLCLARIQLDTSAPELADRVCSAMEQSEDEDLRLLGEDCDRFKDRLTNLLSIEPLVYAAKASSVMTAHDHTFVHARTLTDARPVFGSDVENPPKAAMIIHTLEIAYRTGRKSENFYVALDSQDVESLIATLQRALAKEAGLKTVLKKSGVTCLGPE